MVVSFFDYYAIRSTKQNQIRHLPFYIHYLLLTQLCFSLYILYTQSSVQSLKILQTQHFFRFLFLTHSSMLQMGFQELAEGRLRSRYERLTTDDVKAARPRRSWVKKMNGRLKGLRLSRSRKLILKGFSVVLFPRRVVRIYTDIVNRMMVDGICPTIIFSSQWGLPVLSHSSVKCRKSDISLYRK